MIFLLKHWRLLAIAAALSASFGAGAWVTVKFYQAAEVKELRAAIIRAEKAEKERQAIEQKYLEQSEEIEDLRRSDASVDSYLNTPIPNSLKRLLNKH